MVYNVLTNEYDDALVHYLRAADLYKGEGYDTQAHQCMEKVAHAYAATVPPDYFKAAAIFEELGINALNSRLGRYSARKFFFRAVLCTMATSDTIGARAKHTQFQEIDCQFSPSQEGKFLSKLIIALEAFDADQFSKAYRDYAAICPLDPWHVTVLRQAQKVLMGDMDNNDDDQQLETAAVANSNQFVEHNATDLSSHFDDDTQLQHPKATTISNDGEKSGLPSNNDDDDDDDDAAMFS